VVLPITKQTELLGLNRSSLYYKPKEPSMEEVMVKHAIDEIYTKYPFYAGVLIIQKMEIKN
jgi:putative transposase